MKPVLRVIAFLFLAGFLLTRLEVLESKRLTTSYDRIRILGVEADPNIAGKVYVVVGKSESPPCAEAYERSECWKKISDDPQAKVFESSDYGRTWNEIPLELITDSSDPSNIYLRHFSFDSELINSSFNIDRVGRIYQYKICCYREIIYDASQAQSRLYYSFNEGSLWGQNRLTWVIASASKADPSTVYLGLNDFGLVIGPNPDYSGTPTRDWFLSNAMLPGTINSLTGPNGGTNFQIFILALVMILIIPPLPYLNGWALMQAFRYAFQPGEEWELNSYVWLIGGIATLSYLVPLTFALVVPSVDFKSTVIVLGIFNVIIGGLGGWWISRKRNFSTAFTRKMIIGCILLSLPVPIGLYFGIIAWCILMALWCAFVGCRAALSQFLEKEGGVGAQWGIDRMALEIPGLFLIIVVPMMTLALGLWYGLMFLRLDALFAIIYPLVALAVVVAIFVNVVIRYLKFRVRRGAWLVKKKAAQPDGANGLRRSDRSLWRKLFDYTLIWVSGTVTVCLCLIWAVTTAPAWFQMLMGF